MLPAEAENDASPFHGVTHARRRAFLEAFVLNGGNKVRAAKAVGISEWTPYTDQWKADEAFQAGLALAEEIVAAHLVVEARRRAVEGVRNYKFVSKTGEPILHPDLCDCGHHRKAHTRVEVTRVIERDLPTGGTERETISEAKPGPCMECVETGGSCTAFEGAPYFEHAYSDALLDRLLEVNEPRYKRAGADRAGAGVTVVVIGANGQAQVPPLDPANDVAVLPAPRRALPEAGEV